MKEQEYMVVEDRGCGIDYPAYEGTLELCEAWMKWNTHPHPLHKGIFVSNEEENVNGNGDMFTYTVEPCD